MAKAGGFTAGQARGIGRQVAARAEAHLMLARPLAEVETWCEFCELVVVHAEAADAAAACARIRELGRQPGIALSPGSEPRPGLLEDLVQAGAELDTAVLVMAVKPGCAGSQFEPSTAARLTSLAPRALLGVDGAMTLERLAAVRQAGANWAVSGTDLLASPNPAAWLTQASAL
jgi:ribulose-phosphate 3-epimerase